MQKKQLFLWSLYDFANSIVFINFLLYFSQWLVIDGGLADIWYNVIFAVTTLILLFSAPVLAAFTDKRGKRKFFLNIATVGTFVGYGTAASLAYFGTSYIVPATIFFLIGQYFYQLAFVFYHPMIESIAEPDHRARASGIGQFANSLGQVSGVLIALPFVGSRVASPLVSVILFFILALPMLIFFKDNKAQKNEINIAESKEDVKNFWSKTRSFFGLSVCAPIIVSFFFFNDALVTLTNNYSIYLERVFGISDMVKSMLLLSILIMSALGGLLSGYIGDKFGNLKTLKIILIGWIITLPIVALAPNFAVLMCITVMMGLLLGSVMTVTRAYLSNTLKSEEIGYGFSFYTLAERFATMFGPLTWGGIILFLGTEALSYRIAVGAMTIFIVVGFVILIKWRKRSL